MSLGFGGKGGIVNYCGIWNSLVKIGEMKFCGKKSFVWKSWRKKMEFEERVGKLYCFRVLGYILFFFSIFLYIIVFLF